MAITKEIKIKYINVQEMKVLQVIGSTIVKDGSDLIAEKEYAFGLEPNINPSEIVAYTNLPDAEKLKVDELTTALWTNTVKENYTKFLAEQNKTS